MLLSIWPTAQQPWSSLVEVVAHADSTGWHGVYLWDHFMGDGGDFGDESVPTLESTAVLAALSALTSNLRIGPLVLGNNYRHPAIVANWAATVDQISGGRLVLGLGAGWQTNEHRQYGIDLPSPGERLFRLDEACSVIRSLLDNAVSDFEGKYYVLSGALCEPKPVQEHLPLLIGGKGDRMLRLVARHADAWNMWGLPSLIAERSAFVDRCCEEIGRDPATLHRSTQALVLLSDDGREASAFVEAAAPRAAIAGPVDHFIEVVLQWKDAGIDEVIIPDMTLGSGSRKLELLDELRESFERCQGG